MKKGNEGLHNTIVCAMESFDRDALRRETILVLDGPDAFEALRDTDSIELSVQYSGGEIALVVNYDGPTVVYQAREEIFDARKAADGAIDEIEAIRGED